MLHEVNTRRILGGPQTNEPETGRLAVGRNQIVPGLGQRLKDARDERGWSQDDLADRTEQMGEPVSKNAISRIERDLMSPTAGVLLSLCRALHVDPGHVLKWGATEGDDFAAEVRRVARWMLRVSESDQIAALLTEDEMPPKDERQGKGVGTPRRKSG